MGAKLPKLIEKAKAKNKDTPSLTIEQFDLSDSSLNVAKIATWALMIAKELPNLRRLTVGSCQLSCVPTEIQLVTALETLFLENNVLRELPDEFRKLRNLKTLYLSNNKIEVFPAVLGKLPLLEYLNLSQNLLGSQQLPAQAEAEPAMLVLPNLQYLNLGHNQLKAFPAVRAKNLQTLTLENNCLTAFPNEVFELEHLTTLNLGDNQITSLPNNIEGWTRLHQLGQILLRRNKITAIPEALGCVTNLKSLDLTNNELVEPLPGTLRKLGLLRNLLLGHNRLTDLGAGVGKGLTSLTILKINDNQLESLPTDIGQLVSLSELYVENNRLKRFPADIGQLGGLRTLSASHNQLDCLPSDFKQLKALSILLLDHNQLKEIPKELLYIRLRRLALEYNPFDEPTQQMLKEKGSLKVIRATQSLLSSPHAQLPAKPPPFNEFRVAFELLMDYLEFPPPKKQEMMRLPDDSKWLLFKQWKEANSAFFAEFAPSTGESSPVVGSANAAPPSPRHSAERIVAAATGSTAALSVPGPSSSSSAAAAAVGQYGTLTPAGYSKSLQRRASAALQEELVALRVLLTSKPPAWIAEFIGSGGVEGVLKHLSLVSFKQRHNARSQAVQLEALRCLAALVKVRADEVLKASPDVLNVVALNLDAPSFRARKLAMDILHTCCTAPRTGTVGRAKVLESLKKAAAFRATPPADAAEPAVTVAASRFAGLMSSLQAELTDDQQRIEAVDGADGDEASAAKVLYPMKIACLGLINAIINNTEELEQRFAMRNELRGLGILKVFQSLKQTNVDFLQVQIDSFKDGMAEDYEEMLETFGPARVLQMMKELAAPSTAPSPASDNVVMVILHTDESQRQVEFIPYDSSTTVQKVVQALQGGHPLLGTSEDYGLYLPPIYQLQTATATPAEAARPQHRRSVGGDEDIARASEGGLWLEGGRTLASYGLSGEVLCEYKMKAVWAEVAFCARGKELQRDRLPFDPSERLSETITRLLVHFTSPGGPLAVFPSNTTGRAKFGSVRSKKAAVAKAVAAAPVSLPEDLHPDDFGLMLHVDGGGVVWLDETKTLSGTPEFVSHTRARVMELKPKPRPLKVKLSDDTAQVMFFDPLTPVAEVVAEVARSVGLAGQRKRDYALLVERERRAGDDTPAPPMFRRATMGHFSASYEAVLEGEAAALWEKQEWLLPTDTTTAISEYHIGETDAVRLVVRPRKAALVVPSGEVKAVLLDFAHTPHQLVDTMCKWLGLQPAKYRLHARRSAEEVVLDKLKPLRDQPPFAEAEGTDEWQLALVDASQSGDDTSQPDEVNIWEAGSQEAQYEEGSHVLKAATLNRLIERLTSEREYDPDSLNAFLLTYHSVTSGDLVLRKVAERYAIPASVAMETALLIRMRVFDLLRLWVEKYLTPSDDAVAEKIRTFVETQMKGDKMLPDVLVKRLLQAFEQRAKGHVPIVSILSAGHATRPTSRRLTSAVAAVTLLDMEEEEVARQLCLHDFKLYAKIEPRELLRLGWSKPSAPETSPNVLAMISSFNDISAGIAALVVREPSLRKRQKLFQKLVLIAHHLKRLHNYQSLNAIIAGLNNASLLRLKWTRKLPKSLAQTLEELEGLMSMEGSYKNYRAALANAGRPCVPYIGVTLTDLVFIQDGNPDFVAPNVINFSKNRQVYQAISNLLQYRSPFYTFEPVPEILAYLLSLPKMDDKSLWEESLKREPRNAQKADLLL